MLVTHLYRCFVPLALMLAPLTKDYWRSSNLQFAGEQGWLCAALLLNECGRVSPDRGSGQQRPSPGAQ